jgi:signal transduction histidine kinase
VTIRRQLTRLVLVAIVPASLAATLLIVHSYERQRASIEQRTLETARALAQTVDRELLRGQAALQVLSTSSLLATGDMPAFHRQVRDAMEFMPGNAIALNDVSGQQLLNTLLPFGEPLPVAGNPSRLRRVAETGRPSVSDLFIGAVAKRPLITLDVPVRRGDQVVFVLSMGFFPDRLGEILARANLPPGWVGAIFDSQGTVVARTHQAERFVGRKGSPALVQRMAQVPEGSVEGPTLEGIPVTGVFSRSGISNWSVAIGIPSADLTGSLWASIAWIMAGTVALLASGIALARVFATRIARSIRGLIPPAVALGRGEKVAVPPLRLEEAREVGQALERASGMLREREQILAVVAHDLRNPLTTLMLGVGAALRLAKTLPGAEPLRAVLDSLAEVVRRMSGLVDDLLAVAVSGNSEGKMLTVAPVNAASLLVRAADAVRPLFARDGIELHVAPAGELPDILADADRILRVFVNLLDNALKFTRPPGRVVIGAQAVPGAVRFCVANSGPALSAAELDSMFHRFWQARPEDRKGAGLGLSICRSIVEMHGGRIWAQPEEGMRVRICFELPAAPAFSPRPAARPGAPSRTGRTSSPPGSGSALSDRPPTGGG